MVHDNHGFGELESSISMRRRDEDWRPSWNNCDPHFCACTV